LKILLFFGVCLTFFFENTIILIMIEIQYSGTALLLLVNPHIPHLNNGTVPQLYLLLSKRICFVTSYVCSTHHAAVRKSTAAIKVAPMKVTDDFVGSQHAYHKINTSW